MEAGASEVILPHVGWINTVPDARAIVDIEINGTALSFSGTGYHDKVRDTRFWPPSKFLLITVRTGAIALSSTTRFCHGTGATLPSAPTASSGLTRSIPKAPSTSAATWLETAKSSQPTANTAPW